MGAEYINPQWRLPNYKTGNNQDYSMSFDGTQAIEIPAGATATDLTGSNTIAAWVKRDETESNHNIVNKRGNTGTQYAFFIETTDKLGFDDGGDPKAYSNSTIPANVWTHVAVVIEAPGCTFYINGVADGGVSSGISVGPNASVITYIGKKYTGAFTLNGKLSQVCFFDYALPATGTNSIATLYNGGNPFNPMALPSPPIGYYPLGNSAHMGSNYVTTNGALQDYVFDFTSDLIDSDFTLTTGQTQFSASIWAKFTGSLGNNESLIANESGYAADGFSIFKDTNDKIVFKCEGQTAVGTTTVALNKWYLATVTYNAGAMILYVNGQQEATQTTSTSITEPSTPQTRLGKYITANAIPFTGELSNAQIWNSKLEASEAQTLYNYGSPIQTLASIPQSSNLKAWYKLDATEIYDNSTTEWKIENNANPSVYTNYLRWPTVKIWLNPRTGSPPYPTGGVSLPDSFTISLWVNLNTNQSAGFFEGESRDDGGWNIFRYNSISNGCYTLQNGGNITSNIIDGKWHHVLFSYDHTTTTLTAYTDNIQTYSSSSIDYNTGNNIARIGSGRDGQGSASNFTGNLSNISIWNNVVTNSQRDEIYNSGTPKDLTNNSNYSNLLNWWPLNNKTTGTQDQKGSNNFYSSTPLIEEYGFINTLTADSSGMSQSNLVTSDLLTTSSYSPYAMSFDGNDYINLGRPSVLDFTPSVDAFSISAWINIDEESTGCIYSFGAGPTTSNTATQIKIGVAGNPNAGKIQAVIGGSETYSTNTVTDSTWKKCYSNCKGQYRRSSKYIFKWIK